MLVNEFVDNIREEMEKSGDVTEQEVQETAFRILEGVQEGSISARDVEDVYNARPEEIDGYDPGDFDTYEGEIQESQTSDPTAMLDQSSLEEHPEYDSETDQQYQDNRELDEVERLERRNEMYRDR